MIRLIMLIFLFASMEHAESGEIFCLRDASLVVIFEVSQDGRIQFKILRNSNKIDDFSVSKFLSRVIDPKDEGRYLYLRKEARDTDGSITKFSTVLTRIEKGVVSYEAGVFEGKIVKRSIPEKEFKTLVKKGGCKCIREHKGGR